MRKRGELDESVQHGCDGARERTSRGDDLDVIVVVVVLKLD